MGSTSTNKLLVIDDDAIVRSWVRSALAGSEFRIVGEADRAGEGIALVERRRPDVLLVDQLLPDWTGIDLVRALRQRGHEVPAVLMTAAPREGLNEEAGKAGVQGTVIKSARPEELLTILRGVLQGQVLLSAQHPRETNPITLSPREREILQLISAGLTNIEIAERLRINRETVKTMLYRSFRKLGVNRRSEAVSEALRLGLLRRPPEGGP